MGDIISRKYVIGQLQDWQFANASHENAEAYNLIGVFIKMIEQVPDAWHVDNTAAILTEKGIKYSYKGFKYLSFAVKYAKDKNGDFKMMKLLDLIAEEYDTTTSAVERSIRHAIHRAGHEKVPKEFIVETAYELECAER